jgi:uncharacterized protein (TIGR02611 family)
VTQRSQAQAVDESERDDWEWRRRIRANPHSHRIYKWVVGVVGLLIIAGGVVLLPLPGPGWVIIFVGLAVWASEFEWARRLRNFAIEKVKAWGEWLQPKPWWVKGLVGLATLLLVLAIFYLMFLVSGVPSFFPDIVERPLQLVPGL